MLTLSLRVALLAFLLVCGTESHLAAQTGSVPDRAGSKQPLSPIIWVERPGAVNSFSVDSAQVTDMVNDALRKLTSAPDVVTAWTRLGVTPQDVVGIKITTAGGTALSTHHPLVHAICDGLRAAGVPSSQIIIWDKFPDRMRAAGYAPRAANPAHAAIAAVIPDNYDPSAFYRNGMIGSLMWGDFRFMQTVGYGADNSDSILDRSYYTKFVTTACTKIINVPVLTDNSYCGMNGCLSTLAIGSVDNNRRFQGPPTYGDTAIGEILDQPFIKRKVIVHILDALVIQAAGGPQFNPIFCQSTGALYVGRDPVAIDSVVLPRLEKLRQSMSVPPIGNNARHIKDAAFYQMGTTDRHRIQLVHIP